VPKWHHRLATPGVSGRRIPKSGLEGVLKIVLYTGNVLCPNAGLPPEK
jgi:hypothetical protein